MTGMMEFLEDLINHPEKANNIGEMIVKTELFFDDMLKKLKEGSLEEQEEIREAFKKIGEMAEQKMEQIASSKGMTKEEMAESIKNPRNFSKEDWQSLQGLQENLSSKTEVFVEKKEQKNKKTSHKRSRWMSA
jgi:hypothetical protein